MQTDKELIEALEADIKSHELTGNGKMRRVEAMRQAAARLRALTAEPVGVKVRCSDGKERTLRQWLMNFAQMTKGTGYLHMAEDASAFLSALEPATAEPDEASGLVEFAKEICRVGFDGGSLDGCDILDTAVKHGLCRITQYHAGMTGIANAEYFEEGDVVYVFDGPLLTAASPRREGWQMVPVEPTEAMLDAGEDARRDRTDTYFDGSEISHGDMVEDIYRAMLASAPQEDGK